jgi:hypothetical protein
METISELIGVACGTPGCTAMNDGSSAANARAHATVSATVIQAGEGRDGLRGQAVDDAALAAPPQPRLRDEVGRTEQGSAGQAAEPLARKESISGPVLRVILG